MSKRLTRALLRNTLLGCIAGIVSGWWFTTSMPGIDPLGIPIIHIGFLIIGGVIGYFIPSD